MTSPEAAEPAGTRRSWAALLLPALGPALVLGLWWLAGRWLASQRFFDRFTLERTAVALFDLVLSGELWLHILTSLRRIAIGLGASFVFGFPLGVLVGSVPWFSRASSTVFQFARMVSPLSWTPLAIMLFGIGDNPVVFLLTMAGVWPIVLSTASAVASFDRRLGAVGRALGATKLEIARTIVWPSIRPQVLTGVRVSIGLGWVVLVPAEMLGVDSGLGYFILSTRDRLAYADLMAGIVIVGGLGWCLDAAARRVLSERPRTSNAREARSPGGNHASTFAAPLDQKT
ncbi:MAG: ABC transporter permease [Polyangiaceae bacterium]